jgi:hypothetical protein
MAGLLASDERVRSDFHEPAEAATQCSSRNIHLALTLLAVVLIWAAAWLQWAARDLVVPWDSKNQFYAFYRFMASAIQTGSSPFWNPFHYAGHPSVADPQSLVFSLPFVAWAFLAPTPSLAAFDTFVFAHLLVGGLALVIYGRRQGWGASACVLSACVFMLGGVVSGRMNHVGIIVVYALFPLALLLMEVALTRRSLWAAAGFAVVASQIALGRSQVALLLCFALVVCLVAHISSQQRLPRYLARRTPTLALMGLGTALLCVLPMLLTLQFAVYSNRPASEIGDALRSSLDPVNLANFFVPNIFGSLEPGQDGWGPSFSTRPDSDSTDRTFNYLFAGSLTALLIVWHGLAGGRSLAAGRRAMAFLAAFALIYAIGRHTPAFAWLFAHAPGVSLFRRPVDGAFLLMIALAFLSGHLVNDFIRHGAPRVPRGVALAAAGLVAGLGGWALAFSAGEAKASAAALELAKSLPIYLCLLLPLILVKTPRARAVAMALAVTLTAGELVWRNAGSVLNAEPHANYALLEDPDGEDARIIAIIKTDMLRRADVAQRPRIEFLGLGGAWQNVAMVLGLEATNGYNPLRIGDYDRFVAPGESPYTIAHRIFPSSFPSYNCALSHRLGLQYLVLGRPIGAIPLLSDRKVTETLLSGPKAWIYRLADTAPRVMLTSRIRFAAASDNPDVARALANAAEVSVDSDEELTQSYRATAAARPGKARIAKWSFDRVEIDVETDAPAIVTLRAPWYPGWQVEVDGVKKPLLLTDILFRGVEVPARSRKVVFAYRPFSLENLSEAAEIIWSRE